jgi:phosphoribosylglycinamide formyltransferase-1
MSVEPIPLAVLVSGSGTTLQNLIDQIADGRLSARIAVVIASRSGIGALDRAARARLMNFVVEKSASAAPGDFSRKVFSLCADAGASLACMAGWLSLLEIPPAFAGRVMNIHPALLPSFGGAGMYGARVHQAVLDHGCKVSGCTVHFVDGQYDNGPIILQRACPVLEDDTAKTLAERVFQEETIAYPEAIRLYQAGRLKIEGRRVRVGAEIA